VKFLHQQPSLPHRRKAAKRKQQMQKKFENLAYSKIFSALGFKKGEKSDPIEFPKVTKNHRSELAKKRDCNRVRKDPNQKWFEYI